MLGVYILFILRNCAWLVGHSPVIVLTVNCTIIALGLLDPLYVYNYRMCSEASKIFASGSYAISAKCLFFVFFYITYYRAFESSGKCVMYRRYCYWTWQIYFLKELSFTGKLVADFGMEMKYSVFFLCLISQPYRVLYFHCFVGTLSWYMLFFFLSSKSNVSKISLFGQC